MYFWKDLELEEGRKVQEREENCKKDWQLEGTAVKGIFERSWMKAENYRKEQKMWPGLAVGKYCCERYFWKELEMDEGRKLQKREGNAKRIDSWNVLLWKVFLKEAGWRHKSTESTEKRREMQKGLAVGRYCCERYFWKELDEGSKTTEKRRKMKNKKGKNTERWETL